ncbi:MAG: FAD:protein FMN transferase [Bacteroidota bacterium]
MNKKALLTFGMLLILTFIIFTFLRKDTPRLSLIYGQTMGTIAYSVKFMGSGEEVNKEEIDSILQALNQSLSTYIPDSEISRLNLTASLQYESVYFYPVLEKSAEVFSKTDGAFDPTVGPLIRAWGFGPEKSVSEVDSIEVDSLLNLVGFKMISFDESQISMPASFQLDFSAIAKGYAVDLVGELLEGRGLSDYLVEIGGEVRCRGVNEDAKSWSLGIEDPTVKLNEQELLAIVRLKDLSLATSGNYRNYYERDGKIYAHIIDPRTGYTAKHPLLSASVFADDCMTADAFATAFMVLGLDKSIEIAEQENVGVILVYQDDSGAIKSYVSPEIRPFVELNKAK